MNKRKFLYFLTNSAGQSYYVENNIVKLSTLPVPLPRNPLGWADQVLKYTRNETYIGLFPSFTLPLRFVKEGAKILRQRFWTYGEEDVIFLIILKLNSLTGKHETYYKGEIDLSKQNDTTNFFEVSVTQSGFYKQLKAYENTVFEVPLKNEADIEMDGLELQKKSNFAVFTGAGVAANLGIHTLGCVYVNDEGTSFGYVTGSAPLEAAGDLTNDDDKYLIKETDNIAKTFEISGLMQYGVKDRSCKHKTWFQVVPGNARYYVENEFIPPVETTIDIPINITIPLPAHSRLYLIAESEPLYFAPSIVFYLETKLAFKSKTKFKTTTVKAIKAFDLGNYLIKKIAGSNYNLSSTMLDKLYLTSGDALRGFENAVIKTTWKDFYTSMFRDSPIGLTENKNTISILPHKDFFDTTSPVYDLGEVSEVTFSIKEELLGTSLKVGYANQDYDNVNGKDEPNTTAIYKLPGTRITKELDLTAKYRADPYGIEFTRINLEGLTTTDNNSDNSVFILDCIKDTANNKIILDRTATNVSGVLNPNSIFNLRLSPKNLLLRHGARYRSILWHQDAKTINFQSVDKNANLSATFNGKIIFESSNVLIANLDSPYFYPIEVKFKTIVQNSLFSIMANNYKQFSFTYLGNKYFGFIQEASQRPSGNESQTWTLILSINNNLQNLIHG